MHPPPDRPRSNVPRMCILMALMALVWLNCPEGDGEPPPAEVLAR